MANADLIVSGRIHQADHRFSDLSRGYGAPEGTRKLKSFEWLDCTNNKVLNVAIAQTIKFRMSRLHKQSFECRDSTNNKVSNVSTAQTIKF